MSDTDSIVSEVPQHFNNRGGFMDDESSNYTDIKQTLNKPLCVVRFDPVKGKNAKVEFFETSLFPNRIIKNAVTGIMQGNCRVGSSDEDLFFSVLLSSGECGKTPPCLFYDSPEQYERHFYTELNEKTKSAWRVKYHLEMDRRQSERNKSSKIETIVVK
jgi:hypothetical protein